MRVPPTAVFSCVRPNGRQLNLTFCFILKLRFHAVDTLKGMTRDSKRDTAIYTAFDDNDQPEISTPEKNLLRAVLLNAVADLRRPGDFNRKALEYFLSKEDDYVFSFQSVCTYLNIDPRQILILVGLNGGRPVDLLGSSAPDIDEVAHEEVDQKV